MLNYHLYSPCPGDGSDPPLQNVGVQPEGDGAVVLGVDLHIRAEHPTGLPPRGDPGSLLSAGAGGTLAQPPSTKR